jgi:histidinol-phosphate phosphatase family protein
VTFGTAARPNVALLDRDGTIIADRSYLTEPDGVALLPGVQTGLRRLSANGWRLVVLTNQSGIGRGLIGPSALDAVHDRLRALLRDAGIPLDGIFVCPHPADAGCDCRKPNDGLARRAAAELAFPLDRAVVAGDKASDIELARRLGVPAFLVTTGCGSATLANGTARPDYVVDGLDELAHVCCHPDGLLTPAD